MTATLSRAGLTLLFLAPIVVAGSGERIAAPVPTVRDEVDLFSLLGRQQATLDAAYVKDHFKKDLRIEALKPPAVPRGLDVKDPKAVKMFFGKWAGDRYKASGIDGVLVVLVPEVKQIRVVVGAATLRSGLFTDQDRQDLQDRMAELLRKDQPDEALTAGTKFVRDAMDRHLARKLDADPTAAVFPGDGKKAPVGAAVPADKATPWTTYLLIGLGVLAGLWLLSGLFRGLSSMGGGPGAGGGGGFMSGMLGGLFGAMAGMWLYNNVFGGSSLSASESPDVGGFAGGGAGNASTGGASQDLGDEPTVSGGDYGEEEKYGGGDWNDTTDAGDWGDAGGDWGDAGGDW